MWIEWRYLIEYASSSGPWLVTVLVFFAVAGAFHGLRRFLRARKKVQALQVRLAALEEERSALEADS